MVEKSAWRRLERRLLPIVYVAILVLFCSSIAFLPTHIDYNPDEARIVNAVRDLGTGWFQEPSWVLRTHLLAQVDFYLLAHVVTVTVGVLKLVGAFFMILSFIYLAWLSYAYSLFSRLSLLVLLIVPTVSVGLFTLAYFSHAELGNPRNEILWMYFSTSGYPQSASGLLGFLGAMTGSFLFSTFLVWPPDHPIVSLVVAGAFGIGLTRSLLERRRDSRRFSIGVYVLLVLVCLAGLSATGLYAFGDIRYALFIHGPLLVVAAYGITDVGRWMWVVGSRTARRFVAPPVVDGARGVGVIALIVLTLVASLATATRVRSIKSDYDREFGTAVQLIKTDRSPLVIYDEYAQINLDAIGIDFPNKRPFFFDAPFLAGRPDVSLTDFDEYRAFLRTGQDILWITYHTPDSAPQFADYLAEIEGTHVRARQLELGLWQIMRWESADATSVAGPLRVGSDGPTNPPRGVTRDEAARLLPAYGSALEMLASHPGTVVDASHLPDSKARLKSAILTFLEDALDPDDPSEPELLRAVYMQLAVFQSRVGDIPVGEDLAAPDGRLWRDVMAQERRALTIELANAGF